MIKNLLKKIFSQNHYKFPRSLVYMMQSSEYDIKEYLRWYWRAQDFRKIEVRKTLVQTAKAKVALILATLTQISLYLIGLLTFFWSWKFALAILILTPLITVALVALWIKILEILVQKPIEKKLIKRAQKKLSEHSALKIAIAGSYGKTTMREILYETISAGKRTARAEKNYNTPIGTARFVNSLRGDEEVLIFELGEYYQGDIKTLCEIINPDIGIITGVNEAHIEKFKTLEKTTSTIFELSDYLKQKENSKIFANAENEIVKKEAEKRGGHTLYSLAGIGDWKVSEVKTDLGGTSFSLRNTVINTTMNLKSGLLGMHQIPSLVVSAQIAIDIGLSVSQIENGIAQTKSFEHRLQKTTSRSGVVMLDDSYNGNPDGVRAVINFMSSLKIDGQKFYLTPGLVEMGKKTEEIHLEIGRQIANSGIENVILINNSVTPHIEKGLQQENYSGKLTKFDDALLAFSALPNMTVSGDVVLIQNDWPDNYR